jgi:hypothetical protein
MQKIFQLLLDLYLMELECITNFPRKTPKITENAPNTPYSQIFQIQPSFYDILLKKWGENHHKLDAIRT